MKRYLYDRQFVLIGEIEVTEFDTFPRKSTLLEPPKLASDEFAVFRGDSWGIITERPSVPALVPQSVSMAQARLALLETGRLADVESALNSLEGDEKTKALIEWEFQTVVHRDRDLVLNVLSGALNMIDSEIDDLFILAASL